MQDQGASNEVRGRARGQRGRGRPRGGRGRGRGTADDSAELDEPAAEPAAEDPAASALPSVGPHALPHDGENASVGPIEDGRQSPPVFAPISPVSASNEPMPANSNSHSDHEWFDLDDTPSTPITPRRRRQTFISHGFQTPQTPMRVNRARTPRAGPHSHNRTRHHVGPAGNRKGHVAADVWTFFEKDGSECTCIFCK